MIDAGVLPALLTLATDGPYTSAEVSRESARILANLSSHMAARVVDVLGPQLVIKRLLDRLEKSADDGTPYHANVSLILYFSEKHLRETAGGDAAVTFPIRNPRVDATCDLNALATRFVKGWAEFNGRWYNEQSWDLGL